MTNPAELPASSSGEIRFGDHTTWYRVTGDLDSDKAPVVVLHGGPGLAHNGCLHMAGLSRDGRAVVHYDQLGCGRSTHLPDVDPSFWTIELFHDELRNLVEHLDLGPIHLVGHSWGGMLGAEIALGDQVTLRSLTIGNSPASMDLWVTAAERQIAELPVQLRNALTENLASGSTDSPEYQEATDYMYRQYFCRVQPTPPNLQATFDQMAADPTVYHAMNGPSEFHVTGSLGDWSIVDRLPNITVPTLVLAGEFDEATPETWEPFLTIPGATSHVFKDASHTPHIEQTDEWLDVVGDFIRSRDRDASGPGGIAKTEPAPTP